MIDEGASDDDLRAKIESQMSVIFRIIGICLGVPPETFTWQYYDKAKKYNDVREVTPLQFYTQHVKPGTCGMLININIITKVSKSRLGYMIWIPIKRDRESAVLQ